MRIHLGPTSLIFDGRTIPRRIGFVDLGQIRCPNNHPIKLGGFSIQEDGGLTCHYRPAERHGECGAKIWLMCVRGRGTRKRFYAADVLYEELKAWEEQSATVEEILEYVGAWWPDSPDSDRLVA